MKYPSILKRGECLESESKCFRLSITMNGIFLIYRTQDNQITWNANVTAADNFRAQDDGNMVLYAKDFTPLWATGTIGCYDCIIELENDGYLYVYNDNDSIWSNSKNT
jgi:hypothetical protein